MSWHDRVGRTADDAGEPEARTEHPSSSTASPSWRSPGCSRPRASLGYEAMPPLMQRVATPY
jgi:hypothetical protein